MIKSAVFGLSLAVGASSVVAGELPRDRGTSVATIERLADGGFAVTLRAAADRKAVLEELCLAADASCTFPEATPATRVGPLHVRGSWSQVAEALLKDSGLGFATGGLSGPGAQLVLVVSIEKATASAGSPAQIDGAGVEQIAPVVPETLQDAEPAVVAEEAAPKEPSAPAAGPMILGMTPGGPTGPLVATPFFAPDGRPIFSVVSQQKAGLNTEPAVTPFFDNDGKSIVVPPADGLPDVMPFAGPDGEPIAAPPPAPPGTPQGMPFPHGFVQRGAPPTSGN